MATPNSQGIQALLEAEKEAAKVIAKARQYRVQRLREAKTEAQREIEQYKADKERQFQEYVKKMEAGDVSGAVERDTAERIRQVQQQFAANKDELVDMLVDAVLRVKPAAAAPTAAGK